MPAAEVSNTRKAVACQRKGRRKEVCGEGHRGQPDLYPRITISALPDDVLLEIFYLYLVEDSWYLAQLGPGPLDDAWHALVHVCHRWRCVVFASPRRLNLRILCTKNRPVKKLLDIWPELPLVIMADDKKISRLGVDNIVAALKQHCRVCHVYLLHTTNSLLKNIMAMKKPFPALTDLTLGSCDENAVVLPDSFLNRSAPQLRSITLLGLGFPELEKLLLSTHHLVIIELLDIPRTGYISPDTMVTALSTLTSLKRFALTFRSPRSRAVRAIRPSPSLTRVVLPALISLVLKGDSEYLEDFVSRIDAPLQQLNIMFFTQLVLDTPLLRYFISRTKTFQEFQAQWSADVVFDSKYVDVTLFGREARPDREIRELRLRISCESFDWQLSSLVQVCSSLPPVSTLDSLNIRIRERSYPQEQQQQRQQQRQDDTESTQWLELCNAFTSVRYLRLSGHMVPLIAPVLKELAEVLPALQNISLWGPQPSGAARTAIEQFVAARLLSDFPVTVHHLGGEGGWEIHWASDILHY